MVRLDGDGVVLREWLERDASELAVQANDRSVWINLRDAFPHPYGLDDAYRFIAMAQSMEPTTYFAIEIDGRIAGGIGYTLHQDVERVGAEIGYWLGAEFRDRGAGTAALRAVTRHAFATHDFLRRLWAVPYVGNAASARILAKVGYRREATLRQAVIKDGRVLDQWMYSVLRDEFEGSSGGS